MSSVFSHESAQRNDAGYLIDIYLSLSLSLSLYIYIYIYICVSKLTITGSDLYFNIGSSLTQAITSVYSCVRV